LRAKRERSKWIKTNIILKSPTLNKYVPLTVPWNKTNLAEMLHAFGMVYLKPNVGTFGKGVIRALAHPNQQFSFQHDIKTYTFNNFGSFADSLEKFTERKPYLIQQGIPMLRYAQRMFDVRVMVQKNPYMRWEATGIIGRLGNPRKIVTNYHSGGTPMDFEWLMSPHLKALEIVQYKQLLSVLGIEVARQLEQYYPYMKEIGLDVAIDGHMKPWILEVNTRPDPYIFKRLSDPSVYRKIYRYGVYSGSIKASRKRKRTS
jgi:glutathione synthase/RimK-type ligase-like ATP-grasp enzyme